MDILEMHYRKIPFYAESRYLLIGKDSTVSKKFPSERKFRQELLNLRPIMVANTIPFMTDPAIVIDVDLKMRQFTEADFANAQNVCNFIIDKVEDMFGHDIEKYYTVFSGRGFHLKFYIRDVIEVIRELEREGFSRNEIEPYFVKAWDLILTQFENRRVSRQLRARAKYFGVDKVVDNIANVNRVVRSEYSINDKSFLPVVPFDHGEFPSSIEDILFVITEPPKYVVTLREDVEVRIAHSGVTKVTNVATVDYYELLRLKTEIPDIIKSVKEVD